MKKKEHSRGKGEGCGVEISLEDNRGPLQTNQIIWSLDGEFGKWLA